MSMSFDALPALAEGKVDLVITSDPVEAPNLVFQPLFRFEVLLAMAKSHPLAGKRFVEPPDLARETLITYPVGPERLDVFQYFLNPAGVQPEGLRTSELSLMILELVKIGRGLAALPNWVLAGALARKQIAALRLGKSGLWSTLYAAIRAADHELAFLNAFIEIARHTAQHTLSNIKPV
jgi:LysR family transcriptional regulator for metE and metH